MEELSNILKNDDNLNDDQLKKYISGEGNAEENHAVEKGMAGSEFINDAVEGLQQIHDKNRIAYTVEMLNRDLKKKTERKKQRRLKLQLKDQSWLYIVIFIFIILIILSYMIVHRMQQQ